MQIGFSMLNTVHQIFLFIGYCSDEFDQQKING
jgi:hypothetical protein